VREQDLAAMSSSQLEKELEKALQSVEQAKTAYTDACKQGIFARFGEAAKEKKGLVADAEAYETQVRGALFKANQSETLSSLSKESLDALASGVGTETVEAVVTNVIKQSSIEGAEEAVTTLGSTMADFAMNGAYAVNDVTVVNQVYNTPDDVIKFVKGWRDKKGIADDVELTDEQLDMFQGELLAEVGKMDFSVPKGTVIIAYSGSHGVDDIEPEKSLGAWKIARNTSEKLGDGATYISNLPAGELIGAKRQLLENAIKKVVGDDDDLVNRIISGTDINWNRLDRAGTCGFCDRPAVDDFVSKKLMGESQKVSDNIIVLIPQPIEEIKDFNKKVFAVTELEQILKNDTYQYINGIPKEQLESIYRESDIGKESVYNIFSKTSQEVVGDDMTLDGQSDLLAKAITEEGILTKESATFTVNKCYDEQNHFVGVELLSKSQEQPLIKAPEETVSKVGHEAVESNKLDKIFDIFNPREKLNIYADVDGKLKFGEPEKYMITQGLDGEFKLEKATIKDIETPLEKIIIKEFTRQ